MHLPQWINWGISLAKLIVVQCQILRINTNDHILYKKTKACKMTSQQSFKLYPYEYVSQTRLGIVEIISKLPTSIVNFMYQLGWATVPRYLAKHNYGGFCDNVFE